MDWSEAIDPYCERTGAGLAAEPLNAVSNLAFLIAALVGWRAARRAGADGAAVPGLIVLTVLVGIGSALFHTVATRWAAAADVIPIALFIHGYFFHALRAFLGLGTGAALAGTAGFALASAGLARLAAPWLGASAGYLPALVALVGVGLAARRRRPLVAGRLLMAAGLFALSLGARIADAPLCEVWPMGTHWLWHLANAGLLGLLIITAAEAGRRDAP